MTVGRGGGVGLYHAVSMCDSATLIGIFYYTTIFFTSDIRRPTPGLRVCSLLGKVEKDAGRREIYVPQTVQASGELTQYKKRDRVDRVG